MASREFDIIIFGATGMAGKYCIEQAHKASKEDSIKFAVAGRSENKLRQCIHEVAEWIHKDDPQKQSEFEDSMNLIVADVDDYESLKKMASKTTCLINTVGPYTKFGEPALKACLEEGTHMLDLSGEMHYNESMRNKYHKTAEEKGVYILATAGFDSIPCETLLQFAKQNFAGHLNSFESFVHFVEGESGSKVNTGTWNSMINIMQNLSKMRPVREQAWTAVFRKPLQQLRFPKKRGMSIGRRQEVPGYTIPFIGGDKPVVTHSEFFRVDNKPDYQRTHIQTYLFVPSILEVIGMVLMSSWMIVLSQCSFGRSLLERFPGFFSFGMFGKGGPTRQQVLTCGFTMYGVGQGWLEGEDREKKPASKLVVKLEGPEVAYMATSICLVHAAICLVKEKDKIPVKGGYLTPGFALENTSLIRRLTERGFNYNVVQ